MAKWEMSEAARKRIEKRILASRLDRTDGPCSAFELVLKEIEAEDFSRPKRFAVELCVYWIRDGSAMYRAYAADVLTEMAHKVSQYEDAHNKMASAMQAMGIIPYPDE